MTSHLTKQVPMLQIPVQKLYAPTPGVHRKSLGIRSTFLAPTHGLAFLSGAGPQWALTTYVYMYIHIYIYLHVYTDVNYGEDAGYQGHVEDGHGMDTGFLMVI